MSNTIYLFSLHTETETEKKRKRGKEEEEETEKERERKRSLFKQERYTKQKKLEKFAELCFLKGQGCSLN